MSKLSEPTATLASSPRLALYCVLAEFIERSPIVADAGAEHTPVVPESAPITGPSAAITPIIR